MNRQIEDKILEIANNFNQLSDLIKATTDKENGGVESDPFPLLTKLKGWDGLHETRDREKIMAIFREAGFEFDPDLMPWCGVGLRAALVLAGYEDPGPRAAKASTYKDYGVKSDNPKRGDIFVSETHVAAIEEVRDDGVLMLNGGNQSDMYCVQPSENRNGKKNYGDMIACRTPQKSV